MDAGLVARANGRTATLLPLTPDGFSGWRGEADEPARDWVERRGFAAKPDQICGLPDADGRLTRFLAGIRGGDAADEIWDFAALAGGLPAGRYRLQAPLPPAAATRAAMGWTLGHYRFRRYRHIDGPGTELVWPRGADRDDVRRQASAIALVRDLINTPAADLDPAGLADAARALAQRHGAEFTVTVGRDLLRANYPAIHAVGRAAAAAPRLIDLRWGRPGDPLVALVGKGVTFDSGGLDIKSAGGMRLMKKDMGGGAHALGLAGMIMDSRLRVRLRVLVPAVENAISGNAMHPLDVLPTRKGLTVEVGNTDAEGRLILADALTAADADTPDLILDFATLTGAARVALGAELPALFCNDDSLADALLAAGAATGDPVWRLPLWPGYRRNLKSMVADLSSTGTSPLGGAITAALFLEHFVSAGTPWAHFDLMAWNSDNRPGRPQGGEAMAIRACLEMLSRRYRRRR